jgi:hypothetical protein
MFLNFSFLFWPSLASYHQKPFLAFIDVLREIRRSVTRKVWKCFEEPVFSGAPAWQVADYLPSL